MSTKNVILYVVNKLNLICYLRKFTSMCESVTCVHSRTEATSITCDINTFTGINSLLSAHVGAEGGALVQRLTPSHIKIFQINQHLVPGRGSSW